MAKGVEIHRFGRKVHTLRTSHGMSTRDLASAIGSTNSYISKVENGKVQPGITFAYKVATYFGVSADALLDDSREV